MTSCADYHRKTNGYFDVTLQNFSKVELDIQNQAVRFHLPHLYIDLGGYAKGYALEKIRVILLKNNISNALINFGNSSVLAIGHHPYGDCWPIGISHPYKPKITLTNFLLQNGETVSVSGNSPWSEKHICNPFTGTYLEDKKVVAIIAPNAIDAEVLSTSLFICPQEEANNLKKKFEVKEIITLI